MDRLMNLLYFARGQRVGESVTKYINPPRLKHKNKIYCYFVYKCINSYYMLHKYGVKFDRKSFGKFMLLIK